MVDTGDKMYDEQVCFGCQHGYMFSDGHSDEDWARRTDGHCKTRRINHCFTQEMADTNAPQMYMMPDGKCTNECP